MSLRLCLKAVEVWLTWLRLVEVRIGATVVGREVLLVVVQAFGVFEWVAVRFSFLSAVRRYVTRPCLRKGWGCTKGPAHPS